nr:hypothetical protein [Tanacetum cinerariifolium]
GRNNNHRRKMNTDVGTCSSTESDRTLNDANPLKEVVSPSVIDEPVAMEVKSPWVAQTNSVKIGGGSYQPLPTQGTTLTENTPEDVGNVLDWVKLHDVPVTAFNEDGLSAIAMKLVDNDEELGTNGGTTNLVNNGVNSNGSSFMNVENSSTSNTPIIDKIRKFEDLLIDGQVILVDEAGNLLKKVECSGNYDSEN